HSFGGKYLEMVPNERLLYTDKFDDPGLPGEMRTTITLKKVSTGTDLSVVQEGVPEAIPPEACYLGWQESLMLLAKLVEAEIPDQMCPPRDTRPRSGARVRRTADACILRHPCAPVGSVCALSSRCSRRTRRSRRES